MFSFLRHCACFSAIAIFILSTCAFGQDSLNVTRLGGLDRYWAWLDDVAVVDTIAYAATGGYVSILDVSDPAHPVEVGYLASAWGSWGLAVDGDHLFVNTHAGIDIADIGDLVHPEIVGHWQESSRSKLAAAHGYLYVSDYQNFDVIDVSNPAAPEGVGSFSFRDLALDIAIQGDFLFMVTANYGLRIFDISDPSNPTSVAAVAGVNLRGIKLFASYALVTSTSNGLMTFDVTDPADPFLVHETPGNYYKIALFSHYAAASWSYGAGLTFFDLTNPANPLFVSSMESSHFAVDIVADDSQLYVLDDYVGLEIIDVNIPAAPEEIGSIYRGSPWDVTVHGDYAYIANGIQGLQVVDVANMASPAVVTDVSLPGETRRVIVQGNHLLAIGPESILSVLDITQPSQPVLISSYDSLDGVTDLTVEGAYVYVASGMEAISILDVSNPTNPVRRGWVGGSAVSVAVEDGFVYFVSTDDEFVIEDARNPSAPIRVGSCHAPDVAPHENDIAISGSRAYLAGVTLRIVDFTNPELPFVVTPAVTDTFYFSSIRVEGNYAYIANPAWDGSALRIFDISGAPVLTGNYFGEFGISHGVVIRNGIAFAAERSQFSIYDCSAALGTAKYPARVTSFSLSPAYPNPFNSATQFELNLPRALGAKIVVYDLLGREVTQLFDGKLTAGSHEFRFDAAGLATGEYFVRVSAPPFTKTKKVFLLR